MRISSSRWPFESSENYKSFRVHIGEASPLVRVGAYSALALKGLFGKRLSSIPVLSKLNGPIMALVAMHNETPTSSRMNTSPCTFCNLPSDQIYDLVIAGSGPGGSLVAENNSSSGKSVLMIEAGEEIDATVAHHTPEQMKKFFAYGGQEIALSLSPMAFAQGKAWGGGSEINSGLYHRIPEKVLNEWIKKIPEVNIDDFTIAASKVEQKLSISPQNAESLGIYTASPIKKMQDYLGWSGGVIPRWRTYDGASFIHHGMSSTYLNSAMKLGAEKLTSHWVTKFKIKNNLVETRVRGVSCKHKILSKELCLSAGVLGTPEILLNSGFAKLRDLVFNFHAMLREAALFSVPVNDLHDIDPYQIWSPDSKLKIGAAVGTPALLASTLASKGIVPDFDFSKIGTYYISLPFEGTSKYFRWRGKLTPIINPSRKMKSDIKTAAIRLREAITAVGGLPLGELSTSISTVHVFGSLPIGKTKILDSLGFVIGTEQKVFVRDASILPSAPLVNPQGPLMQLVTVLENCRTK